MYVIFLFGLTLPALLEGLQPFVINTWAFTNATEEAWNVLYNEGRSALDAVERGCTVCEQMQCDGTVGYGGDPDENGETTLDALIMDGTTHDVGAVGDLRRVKGAISVARMVMEHTTHTLLVGNHATEFAIMMGFQEENLTTNNSVSIYTKWLNQSCQPNYWVEVLPDPSTSCGPYEPLNSFSHEFKKWSVAKEGKKVHRYNHDTIGMVAIDLQGHIAAGTSTNGLNHKIPGRVGDSPIPGSGAYVDKFVGGAAATGDGDILMRFSPAMVTVEKMRNGISPTKAAEEALLRIATYYPEYSGAIVATTTEGVFGAACHGFGEFHYSVANADLQPVTVLSVPCIG